MQNNVNSSSIAPARPAELTDRELINALREQVRPAEGDPVDVVAVRKDAADVVQFADLVGALGAEAVELQQGQAANRDTQHKIEQLREPVSFEERGELSLEGREDLELRIAELEAETGVSGGATEAPGAPDGANDKADAAEAVVNAAAAVAADADEVVATEAEIVEEEISSAVRLEVAASRVQDENQALQQRKVALTERASKLTTAGDNDETNEIVARIAEATAQQIASQGSRAIAAQTQRLVPTSIAIFGGGDR